MHGKPNVPKPRTGQGSKKLSREEFGKRYRGQFCDPAFGAAAAEIRKITEIAWQLYDAGEKNAKTRTAGPEFSDPDKELAVEWLDTRAEIRRAEAAFSDGTLPDRILLIQASPRTDETCPGEMAKSFRLARVAESTLVERGAVVDFLDLSDLNAEYGRKIFPCKACVSTAMPLCHWPCSCYPNHSMGQTQDWMNELYPRWVAAHGVMIISPVHWWQAPSTLKLMIDRLVCADGGNPDPTTTDGKNPQLAKEIELRGWEYPKHLAGRLFSIIAHGDAEGASDLRRALADWLASMGLLPAGRISALDRYIGYYESYAASHEALDRAPEMFVETRQAAVTLHEAIREQRAGRKIPGDDLQPPRMK